MRVETVAVLIAAVSAVASAISAYTNRQAMARAQRPFVWPAISHGSDPDGTRVLRIRLHNDGTGPAYDVRWSVGSLTESESGEVVDDAHFTKAHVSPVIRALRASEVLPPDESWLEKAVALPEDDVWWVLVRWTDSAGARWELTEQGPSLLRFEPRRLRTWRWQAWRSPRDW
jgi:hypothetical protein